MTAKRAAVTGGTGFIGANLVRRLLADGHDVTVLSRPASDRWRLEDVVPAVRIVEVDIRDRAAVARAIGDAKPDWMFHLAARGNSSWETDVREIAATVFGGTINLIEACGAAGCETFLNAGSSSEYGFKDHAPSEQEWLEPNSEYAVAKAAATLFGRYAASRRDMRIVTLRLYSVYGPWEEPARLIPTIVVRGLEGTWPPLVNPDIARDFVYVADVVDAFCVAAERAASGAVYNVGTGVQTTMRQVADVAARSVGIAAAPPWGRMPPRQWDSPIWVADPSRIGRELCWTAAHTFERGFRCFVDWLVQRPDVLARYRRVAAASSR